MRLEGRLWKSGEHWLIEVPALAAMTQGRTTTASSAMPITTLLRSTTS